MKICVINAENGLVNIFNIPNNLKVDVEEYLIENDLINNTADWIEVKSINVDLEGF